MVAVEAVYIVAMAIHSGHGDTMVAGYMVATAISW